MTLGVDPSAYESQQLFDELLRTISDVLDIRTVFPRVSEIAKKMLTHDALVMVFTDRDRHFVHQAKSPGDFPAPTSVTTKTPIPTNKSSATSPQTHCRPSNPRMRSIRSLRPDIVRC